MKTPSKNGVLLLDRERWLDRNIKLATGKNDNVIQKTNTKLRLNNRLKSYVAEQKSRHRVMSHKSVKRQHAGSKTHTHAQWHLPLCLPVTHTHTHWHSSIFDPILSLQQWRNVRRQQHCRVVPRRSPGHRGRISISPNPRGKTLSQRWRMGLGGGVCVSVCMGVWV